MGKQFKYIDTFLSEKGLANPILKILIPDADRYKTIAYQHQGEVESSEGIEKYIRNKNRKLATNKFRQFFKIASEEKVNLALTPEYSCPWKNIEEIIKSNLFPDEGNVWIIGCESITPNELKNFVDIINNTSVVLICEPEALACQDDIFFDPVCYLFKTNSNNSSIFKDVLVIQFKTHPMGAAVPIEAQYMWTGNTRYIIRNNDNSIYLATIICSESMGLDMIKSFKGFRNNPYLIIHLQLNPSPRTFNFRSYRTNLYNNSFDDMNKETICLNWAKGTKIGVMEMNYGGSAYYIKSSKIDWSSDSIWKNDLLGMYYNNWESAHSSILIFDYYETLFLYDNFKVSQHGASPQNSSRFGPKMLKIFIWADSSWKGSRKIQNEELKKLCKLKIKGDFDYFLDENLSTINRERLLTLTAGDINYKRWYEPINNNSFIINDDEKCHRISLIQDPDADVLRRKENLLSRYNSLVSTYIKDPSNFPNNGNFDDLKKGCNILYGEESLNHNAISSNGSKASLSYIGDSTKDRAKLVLDLIIGSFSNESFDKNRIIVWYRRGVNLLPECVSDSPDINENTSKSPNSITKTSEP